MIGPENKLSTRASMLSQFIHCFQRVKAQVNQIW